MQFLLAGATGLEPATFCVTGRRSNQLSYAPKNKIQLKSNLYQGRESNSRPQAYESCALTN